MLSYTTLQAQCPSGWLSNTDALGSVEQEYRLVSWSTFTTVLKYFEYVAVLCRQVIQYDPVLQLQAASWSNSN